MSSTLSDRQRDHIRALLSRVNLSRGLGTLDQPCSIAAINIALVGQLTDQVPECMSLVVGEWIIAIQDRMPDHARNSPRWKDLLPLAAGTGRELEIERVSILLEHWRQVTLPLVQSAVEGVFGTAYSPSGQRWLEESAQRLAQRLAWAEKRVEEATAKTRALEAEAAAQETAKVAAVAVEGVVGGVVLAEGAAPAAGAWERLDPAGLLARLISAER